MCVWNWDCCFWMRANLNKLKILWSSLWHHSTSTSTNTWAKRSSLTRRKELNAMRYWQDAMNLLMIAKDRGISVLNAKRKWGILIFLPIFKRYLRLYSPLFWVRFRLTMRRFCWTSLTVCLSRWMWTHTWKLMNASIRELRRAHLCRMLWTTLKIYKQLKSLSFKIIALGFGRGLKKFMKGKLSMISYLCVKNLSTFSVRGLLPGPSETISEFLFIYICNYFSNTFFVYN